MQWNTHRRDTDFTLSDEVVDLSYRIDCPQLPVDHAWNLYLAICDALPWLPEEPCAAIHSIYDAASGNGWMRPATTHGELMQLSQRTKLYLRLPKHRLAEAAKLSGQMLDIRGHPLKIGVSTIKPLAAWHTIFARAVIGEANWTPSDDGEAEFSREINDSLNLMNIFPPKLLCGRSYTLIKNGAVLNVRSLMLADLKLDESIRLQQHGLGNNLTLGCGIFLPHKSVSAVHGCSRSAED